MKRNIIDWKAFMIGVLISILLTLMLTCLSSCVSMQDEDGNTFYRLSPTAHKTISDAGDAGTNILGILSVFFPALGPIAGAAAAGTYTWKRMGKQVTKYKQPLEHTVYVLEELKKNKELWAKVKPYLKGEADNVWSIPSANTEATIREIVDENQGAT